MSEHVRVCRSDELREAQGTPGLTRHVAFEGDDHWFGHVEAAPEMMSGWHHHGDNVTIGYVLKGELTLEFGPVGASPSWPGRVSTSRSPSTRCIARATCRAPQGSRDRALWGWPTGVPRRGTRTGLDAAGPGLARTSRHDPVGLLNRPRWAVPASPGVRLGQQAA